MSDPRTFSTLAPALRLDPYPFYAEMRERLPMFWSDAENAWVVMRYAHVSAAFEHPRLLCGELGATLRKIGQKADVDLQEVVLQMETALFFRNAPGHAPARRLMAKVLAARPAAAWANAIDRITSRLIAPLHRDGGIDLVTDYAEPLPPCFMGWLFGLEEADALWLATALQGVPTLLDRARALREYRAVDARLVDAHAFLRERIAARRSAPGDDALSLLLTLNAREATPLDDRQLAAIAVFLFVAGFETTAALVGNGLALILGHPGQRDRLKAAPDLVEGAVEETLRLEPPIQQTSRYAAEDLAFQDERVDAGDRVLLLISAANRDPSAFANPDAFLPGRDGPPVLSLGHGTHNCLGARIARMESAMAFRKLLEAPPVRVVEHQPEWWPNQNQRRLKRLPVQIV